MKRQPQYRDEKFKNEGWTKKNEAFAMADSNQARNKVSQMANKEYKKRKIQLEEDSRANEF